jgi:hypothetical protein
VIAPHACRWADFGGRKSDYFFISETSFLEQNFGKFQVQFTWTAESKNSPATGVKNSAMTLNRIPRQTFFFQKIVVFQGTLF